MLNFPCSSYCVFSLSWLAQDWYPRFWLLWAGCCEHSWLCCLVDISNHFCWVCAQEGFSGCIFGCCRYCQSKYSFPKCLLLYTVVIWGVFYCDFICISLMANHVLYWSFVHLDALCEISVHNSFFKNCPFFFVLSLLTHRSSWCILDGCPLSDHVRQVYLFSQSVACLWTLLRVSVEVSFIMFFFYAVFLCPL